MPGTRTLPRLRSEDVGTRNSKRERTATNAFYLSLPLLAWFATHRRFPLLVGVFVMATVVAKRLNVSMPSGLLVRFLIGMACAHLMVLGLVCH